MKLNSRSRKCCETDLHHHITGVQKDRIDPLWATHFREPVVGNQKNWRKPSKPLRPSRTEYQANKQILNG